MDNATVLLREVDAMTDQEQNEALARWAGFTWDGFWIDPDNHTFSVPWDNEGEPREACVPDLLHSLDAQAKWLWPKLQKLGYELRIYTGQEGSDTHCLVIQPSLGQVTGIKQAQDPAEACAEAILALIEPECDHEWVCADNEVVSGCEVCLECKTIRAASAA